MVYIFKDRGRRIIMAYTYGNDNENGSRPDSTQGTYSQNGGAYGQNSSGTYSSQGSGTYSGQGNYGYGSYGYGQNYGQGTYTNNGSQFNMNGSPNKKPKKHINKVAVKAVALVLVGVLAGSLVTYGLSNGRSSSDQASAETESKDNEKVTLKKSDSSTQDNTKAEAKSDTKTETAEGKKTSDSTSKTTQTTGSSTDMSVSDIATKCLPSVVAITNKGTTEIRSMWGNFTQDSESSGSGVIIGETDSELLILTNYHVVEGSQQLSVVFSWEDSTNKNDASSADIITAQVKDYDEDSDIAVISIPMSELSSDTRSKITVATVGESTSLKLGQQVVAIGNALGYGQSVTTGIISALNREISIQNDSGATITNKYIQTDAAINPGNSGGAMFNMKGELVGINSAKISSSSVESMGYAIPISDVMDKVETMMNQTTKQVVSEDKRGYLGVSIIDVTSDISSSYGMPEGVYISAVSSGSGAATAGLTKGDIITGINGKKVTTTAELKSYLSYYAVGDTVTVTIERPGDNGYTSKSVDVKLTAASKETKESESSAQSGTDNSGNSGDSGSNGDNSENDIRQFFFGGQGGSSNGGY
jgi:serine protease Do